MAETANPIDAEALTMIFIAESEGFHCGYNGKPNDNPYDDGDANRRFAWQFGYDMGDGASGNEVDDDAGDECEARIKELEAALSTAEADRKALMEVVRQFADPNNWSANRNMWVRPDDPVRLAASVLRPEAEGKGTP